MNKPRLREALIASTKAQVTPKRSENEEFERIEAELRAAEIQREPTLKTIPKFYDGRGKVGEISAHVEFVARRRMLRRFQHSLLSHAELESLWMLLAQSVGDQEEERINYETFCNVRDSIYSTCQSEELANAKFGKLFAPSTFLKFKTDSYGGISAAAFFDYVTRKSGTDQLRIGLSFYDSHGEGYLTEKDLEMYMFDQIPTLPHVASLHKSFYPYYATASIRKFLFFLDPKSTGKIKISDLVLSPLMAELEEARGGSEGEGEREMNWFTARTALRVYGQFVNLDGDRDGMVSWMDLMRWGTGTLTETYAKALCSRTRKGKMGFREFVDFVLAMEHKGTPEALAYHFKCLDYMQRGYLTIADINYWFRDISAKLLHANLDVIPVEDVRDEIFDMICPADPYHITLADVVKSRVGDVFVGILTDMNCFWLYEIRESLASSNEEQ